AALPLVRGRRERSERGGRSHAVSKARLCRYLLSSFLFGSSTGEDTCYSIISFVTGVLVKWGRDLFHGNFAGPGFRPRRWIVDRELIQERVFIGACEALDDTQVLTRSSESRFVAEIRGFDDKGFTLPMTARIPHQ